MPIDLNCDMGESFGAYTIGHDAEVMPFITSANVACGFHGGDPMVIRDTIRLAKKHGVAVGAHPGFPDLVGFGRREMHMTAREVEDSLIYQIGAVAGLAAAEGVRLQHVKAHGMLYNMAVKDAALAEAIARAIAGVKGVRNRRIGGDALVFRFESELGRRTGVRVDMRFGYVD